jgi:hypothetical protein
MEEDELKKIRDGFDSENPEDWARVCPVIARMDFATVGLSEEDQKKYDSQIELQLANEIGQLLLRHNFIKFVNDGKSVEAKILAMRWKD